MVICNNFPNRELAIWPCSHKMPAVQAEQLPFLFYKQPLQDRILISVFVFNVLYSQTTP